MRIPPYVLCALLIACGGGGGEGGPASGTGGNGKAGNGGSDKDAAMAQEDAQTPMAGNGTGKHDAAMPMKPDAAEPAMADAAMPDAAMADASVGEDAATKDSTVADSGMNAAMDAGPDAAASDAGRDAAAPACVVAADCDYLDSECGDGRCNTASGECELAALNEGEACGGAAPDCTARTCVAGLCMLANQGVGAPCGDQGVACHADDKCDGAGNCSDNGVLSAGAICGDRTATPCDGADTCDSAGQCLSNVAETNAVCASATSDCALPKRCNEAKQCVATGVKDAGAPCGKASSGLCDASDTCDGAGTCQANHVSEGTDCTSASQDCRMGDMCNANGACVPGTALPLGTACGQATATECDEPDTCDGSGVCLSSPLPSDTLCGNQSYACLTDPLCDGSGICLSGELIPNCRVTASGFVLAENLGVEGVTVEVLSDPAAGTAVTDASGAFTLEVLPGAPLLLVAQGLAGYWGRISKRSVLAQDPTLGTIRLTSDDEMVALAGQVSELPPLAGELSVFVAHFSGAVGGEAAVLSADSSPAISYDGNGAPVLSSTVLAPSRPELAFTNVQPGTTTVTIAGADGLTTCMPTLAGSAPWAMLAHTITDAEFACTPL